MNWMRITEDHVDAFLHYGLRVFLAISLAGLALASYAILNGWE